MVPYFVVFGLLALGAAIVAWATRHTYMTPRTESQDPVANAAIAAETSVDLDPFAHAPVTSELEVHQS